jgi:GNAT superfamily N-acetyltransferase
VTTPFFIRDAREDDAPACIAFIEALQALEQPLTRDRRLDRAAGAEYHAVLTERARTREGKILVAEAGGRPIGWVVAHTDEQDVFVEAELRRYGYVAELYVEPAWRGSGAGQALIAAAEAHLRTTGVRYLLIGVVEGNLRAQGAYRKAGFVHYTHELRKWL